MNPHNTEFTRHTLERDDDLPLTFTGWVIGAGITFGHCGRQCVVTIYRTAGDHIIAYVDMHTLDPQGHLLDQGPRTASPPGSSSDVLAWLRKSNGGRLGMASVKAWERACITCPDLGDAVEEVI